MTPVEAISTSVGRAPSALATPAASSAASSRPGMPLATLAFFATTAKARSRPPATCSRLMVTLGPANRERVNTAAAGQGASAAITTKSSVSSLIPMLATWHRKPRGRATTSALMARACQRVTAGSEPLPAAPSPITIALSTASQVRRSQGASTKE